MTGHNWCSMRSWGKGQHTIDLTVSWLADSSSEEGKIKAQAMYHLTFLSFWLALFPKTKCKTRTNQLKLMGTSPPGPFQLKPAGRRQGISFLYCEPPLLPLSFYNPIQLNVRQAETQEPLRCWSTFIHHQSPFCAFRFSRSTDFLWPWKWRVAYGQYGEGEFHTVLFKYCIAK